MSIKSFLPALMAATTLAIAGAACATQPEPDPRIAQNNEQILRLSADLTKAQEQIVELTTRVDQLESNASRAAMPEDGNMAMYDPFMPMLDAQALRERVAELKLQGLRFTRDTATPDQAAIADATTGCIANAAGDAGITEADASDLAWAETGAAADDRALVETSLEYCSLNIVMTAMMNPIAAGASPDPEQLLSDLLPADGLTPEHPDVVRLAGCGPTEEPESDRRLIAAHYLSALPEPARAAAIRLYCES